MRQFRLNVAYMLPFAALVLALAAGPTFASPLLKRPTWVFLGEISYGIYIYHWVPRTAFDFYLDHGFIPPAWLVTGVIVGTIMFSAASYLWYERPLRLFLRKKLGH
jgi:peptidoglycan/LPS O-acetylase OafA/YrhL